MLAANFRVENAMRLTPPTDQSLCDMFQNYFVTFAEYIEQLNIGQSRTKEEVALHNDDDDDQH